MATTEGMPKYPRLHAADSYSGRIPAYPADFAAAEAQWQVEESSRAMSEGRGAFSDAWGEHSEEAPGGAKCTIAVSSRAHESKNRCWRTQTTFVFGAGQPVLSPQELSDLQVPTARLPGVAAQLALAHTNGPSLIDGRGVLLWEPGEVGAADEATGDGRPIVNVFEYAGQRFVYEPRAFVTANWQRLEPETGSIMNIFLPWHEQSGFSPESGVVLGAVMLPGNTSRCWTEPLEGGGTKVTCVSYACADLGGYLPRRVLNAASGASFMDGEKAALKRAWALLQSKSLW